MQAIKDELLPMVEPQLDRLREAITHHSDFKLLNCGVISEEPWFFSIGISCQPLDYPLSDVIFGFACVAVKSPLAKAATIFAGVGWHRTRLNSPTIRHPGFAIYEANTANLTYSDKTTLERIAVDFPRLEVATLRGLRRGHPPSRFVTFLDRITGRCVAPKTYPLTADPGPVGMRHSSH